MACGKCEANKKRLAELEKAKKQIAPQTKELNPKKQDANDSSK